VRPLLGCHHETFYPSAPRNLANSEKEEIEMMPELARLKEDHKTLRQDIIAKYGPIKKADSADAARLRILENSIRSTDIVVVDLYWC
jgi:hypothetical protein